MKYPNSIYIDWNISGSCAHGILREYPGSSVKMCTFYLENKNIDDSTFFFSRKWCEKVVFVVYRIKKIDTKIIYFGFYWSIWNISIINKIVWMSPYIKKLTNLIPLKFSEKSVFIGQYNIGQSHTFGCFYFIINLQTHGFRSLIHFLEHSSIFKT